MLHLTMTLIILILSNITTYALGYAMAYKLGMARGDAVGFSRRHYGTLQIDNPRKDI